MYIVKKEQHVVETNNAALPLSSAVRTGLEPATSGVTGRHSNQLNYRTRIPLWELPSGFLSRLRVQSYNIFFIPANFSQNIFKIFILFLHTLPHLLHSTCKKISIPNSQSSINIVI